MNNLILLPAKGYKTQGRIRFSKSSENVYVFFFLRVYLDWFLNHVNAARLWQLGLIVSLIWLIKKGKKIKPMID
jgi:hypothetical protein